MGERSFGATTEVSLVQLRPDTAAPGGIRATFAAFYESENEGASRKKHVGNLRVWPVSQSYFAVRGAAFGRLCRISRKFGDAKNRRENRREEKSAFTAIATRLWESLTV
jgi:hypothetical protein